MCFTLQGGNQGLTVVIQGQGQTTGQLQVIPQGVTVIPGPGQQLMQAAMPNGQVQRFLFTPMVPAPTPAPAPVSAPAAPSNTTPSSVPPTAAPTAATSTTPAPIQTGGTVTFQKWTQLLHFCCLVVFWCRASTKFGKKYGIWFWVISSSRRVWNNFIFIFILYGFCKYLLPFFPCFWGSRLIVLPKHYTGSAGETSQCSLQMTIT